MRVGELEGRPGEQPAGERLVIRIHLPSEGGGSEVAPEPAPARAPRAAFGVAGAALVALLAWGGYALMSAGGRGEPASSQPGETVATAGTRRESTPGPAPEPAPAPGPEAARAVQVAPSAQSTPSPAVSTAMSPVDEVLPRASRGALDTITGTIRVVVRVEVGDDGRVVAVAPDIPGPSRYFERLAREAAGQWTFTPAQAGAPRAARIRFSYTRAGVTASAEPVSN